MNLCDRCHKQTPTRFWMLTKLGYCEPCADQINIDRVELGLRPIAWEPKS